VLVSKYLLSFLLPRSFIGGIIDSISGIEDKRYKRSKAKSGEFLRSYDLHMDNTKYRRAVVDAKAAGLHPLFALGASGFSAPPTSAGTSTPAGQEQTRPSRLGASIDAAILGGERKQRQSGMDAELQKNNIAQRRNLDSRSQLNEMEAQRLASDNAMNARDPWDTGTLRGTPVGSDFEAVGVGPPDARTFGIGTRARSLGRRPITMESNRSSPMREEVIADDGERYRVISSKYDELAQVDLPYQIAKRKAYRFLWQTRPNATTAWIKSQWSIIKARRNKILLTRRAQRDRVEQRTWRGRR